MDVIYAILRYMLSQTGAVRKESSPFDRMITIPCHIKWGTSLFTGVDHDNGKSKRARLLDCSVVEMADNESLEISWPLTAPDPVVNVQH